MGWIFFSHKMNFFQEVISPRFSWNYYLVRYFDGNPNFHKATVLGDLNFHEILMKLSTHDAHSIEELS
jgi:hypothetical protein